jgi:hypothetical protein
MMQNNAAYQVAVSPEGDAWANNASGEVLMWNGNKFVEQAAGSCAGTIAVGPRSSGLSHGTPWITGCHPGSDGNYAVYQMQSNGTFKQMQADVATQVAVSPEGNAWAINSAGQILYWNGTKFVENAAKGCATSIAVGPNSDGLTNGTPWITGCSTFADGNHSVYQKKTGGAWVLMQNDAAWKIAVSPSGNAWAISAQN